MKAFADDNFNVAHMEQFVFDLVKNIVGKKGENAFSPFTTMFSKASFRGLLQVIFVWIKLKPFLSEYGYISFSLDKQHVVPATLW